MLKIQRPLCPDLTFRLTHDISPDTFVEDDDLDLDITREQFIFSCLAKQRDSFSGKVKESILNKVKDSVGDGVKENLIETKIKETLYTEKFKDKKHHDHSDINEKISPYEIKQRTIEQLNNVINEQYHSNPEPGKKNGYHKDVVETKNFAKDENQVVTAAVPEPCPTKPVRKPRKLPEIPKNHPNSPDNDAAAASNNSRPPSNSKCLADELQEALLQEVHQHGNDYDDDDDVFLPDSTNQTKNSQSTNKVYPKFSGNYLEELKKLNFNSVSKNTRPYLTSNNVYLAEDSTEDSQRHLSVASAGGRRRRNSSGDGSKRKSVSSVASTHYQDLEVTHRGMHRFVPRHKDEMTIEIGDPIHVFSEADDLWCEGVNLRTYQRGIFPSMYATDLQFLEDDSESDGSSRFNMRFLGSVEVNEHKGDDVLCQAINKVALSRRSAKSSPPPPVCTVEVSQYGIRMLDKSKTGHEGNAYTHFFALKNISFCGYHPRNERYFAFITKHPQQYRFACHVFLGEKSTRSVSEALGNAFKRFYQEYMAFTHPTEDIYME